MEATGSSGAAGDVREDDARSSVQRERDGERDANGLLEQRAEAWHLRAGYPASLILKYFLKQGATTRIVRHITYCIFCTTYYATF